MDKEVNDALIPDSEMPCDGCGEIGTTQWVGEDSSRGMFLCELCRRRTPTELFQMVLRFSHRALTKEREYNV